MPFETISFLSDYGLADEFVGVVKAVVRRIAPEVQVVDLTHEVAPHDVRGGALTLERSAPYLLPSVILAVVDPGVATARRAVAVEVAGGALVGPDNGLLAPALEALGGPVRVVDLVNPAFQLDSPGPTFGGRDVMAPAAAHLCRGVDIEDLGTRVDPESLCPMAAPTRRIEGARLVAEVTWVDRYGNVELAAGPDHLPRASEHRLVVISGERPGASRTAYVSSSYAGVAPGALGIVVDSYGRLSIAAYRRSAAEELGLGPGDEIGLEAAGPTEGSGGGRPGEEGEQ